MSQDTQQHLKRSKSPEFGYSKFLLFYEIPVKF